MNTNNPSPSSRPLAGARVNGAVLLCAGGGGIIICAKDGTQRARAS